MIVLGLLAGLDRRPARGRQDRPADRRPPALGRADLPRPGAAHRHPGRHRQRRRHRRAAAAAAVRAPRSACWSPACGRTAATPASGRARGRRGKRPRDHRQRRLDARLGHRPRRGRPGPSASSTPVSTSCCRPSSDASSSCKPGRSPTSSRCPIPLLTNVASMGDAFIAAGLGWFVFSTLLRGKEDPQGGISLGPGRAASSPQSSIGLERPDRARRPPWRRPAAPPLRRLGARVREHPYVRLALDARFAGFWLAQTISLFGDRLHQVALGVLVYALTDSPLLTGLVVPRRDAAQPPAGPDRRHVRRSLGAQAGHDRQRPDPRRAGAGNPVRRRDQHRARLPAGLPDHHGQPLLPTGQDGDSSRASCARTTCMAANSATWTADTLADIVGFPLAGLFVAFLGAGSRRPRHWRSFADSATYVLSAPCSWSASRSTPHRPRCRRRASAARSASSSPSWPRAGSFLRSQPALIQNTLISTLAQMSVGVTLALTRRLRARRARRHGHPVPAELRRDRDRDRRRQPGRRARRGRTRCAAAQGLAGRGRLHRHGPGHGRARPDRNVGLALAAAAIIGIANLVFIIPTQTIFIEITPIELMGRVVAFRSSLVFGAMTLAMGVSGILAESIEVGLVIAGVRRADRCGRGDRRIAAGRS